LKRALLERRGNGMSDYHMSHRLMPPANGLALSCRPARPHPRKISAIRAPQAVGSSAVLGGALELRMPCG
jgi:hypothetical protein